jgi:hypothetical protein
LARFVTAALPPPAPGPGAHVARIVRAKEKVSENGNSMLVMTAKFLDHSELGFIITFVPKAAKLVGFFCRSCGLELPEGAGVEVEIRSEDVEGRVFYPVVELDGDGLEAIPKITRFLSRSEALAINSSIATIRVNQEPAALSVVGNNHGGRQANV